MPRVRVEEAAAQELAEAATWYEARMPGTGARLVDAFEDTVALLREEPFPLAAMSGYAGKLGAKRLLLHRFPFDVIIVEEPDELVVIAVAHQSRRPGYWRDRLST